LVCAAKGYQIRTVISDAFSWEKVDHMAALGTELTLVPSDGGRTTRELILDMIEAARTLSLELRPNYEHCNKALPPDSLEPRICSYECTFCATCVEMVLDNVCPNCGGGFAPRPIRPATNWKGDNFLGKDPASTRIGHRTVDPAAYGKFSAPIRNIRPEKR
jgi:hypothetical protein